MHGTFASGGLVAPIGWVVPSNTVSQQQLRCSRFGAPPWTTEKNGGSHAWDADQFWSGHYLFVPGEIDEMLLLRDAGNTAAPTDGQTYPIVTKSHWQIRCLSTLAKGSGEGFIALSPSGTQYRFDWLVNRGYSARKSGSCRPWSPTASATR
jgi:hypothetical protein